MRKVCLHSIKSALGKQIGGGEDEIFTIIISEVLSLSQT
jgi:hypothetical protein